MTDAVERRISELRDRPSVPVPEPLISAARAKAGGLRSRRTRALRTRVAIAMAVALGILAMSFTPPGRAATGWIADLAGVGEPPTLRQVGSVEGSATVLASGRLSDGTPYEFVAKAINAETFAEAATNSDEKEKAMLDRPGFRNIPEMLCFQVDWPGTKPTGEGGACTTSHRTDEGNKPILETSGLWRAPGAEHSSPAIFMGIADDQRVARVRVIQVDRDGSQTELPSQLLTVEGETLQRTGGRYPVAAFFAPLDEDVVAAGNDRQAQVSAIAYDSQGNELDRTDAYPPLDCPRDPQKLWPPEPDGPRLQHPDTPADRAAFQRVAECGAPPVPHPGK
jgi:hypothetical protein